MFDILNAILKGENSGGDKIVKSEDRSEDFEGSNKFNKSFVGG